MKKTLSILTVVFLLMGLMAFSASAAAATGKNLAINEGDSYDINNWRIISKNEGGMRLENGKIIAANAQDGDLFGPQGVYDEFTISFDMITTPGTWFGMTFGNENPDDFFGVTNQVLFMIGVDRFFAMIPVKSGGGEHYYTPNEGSNWFSENMYELGLDGQFTRFIVSFGADKKLKVSYKLPGENESVLSAPRAVFYDVAESEGYINFVATGVGATGSCYEVKNLKIYNTADADTSVVIPASKPAVVTEGLLNKTAKSEAATADTVKLSVEDVAGAKAYAVNVFDKDGTFVKTETFTDKNAIEVKGLNSGTEYKFQVLALGASNTILGYIASVDVETIAGSTTNSTTTSVTTTTTKRDDINTGESSNSFVIVTALLSAVAVIFIIANKKRASLNK